MFFNDEDDGLEWPWDSSYPSDTPTPAPNGEPLDATAAPVPVTPSTDLDSTTNDRSAGGGNADNPLDVSNSSPSADGKSPFSLSDQNEPSPYHLIDPKDLNYGSILSEIAPEFSGDALGYYSTPSALSFLIFCSDNPKEIVSGMISPDSTTAGLIVAGVAMAGAVIVTGGVALGPLAAVGFAAFDVGKAGYEAYEFVDCIPARGAALESLINNFEYTGPLTPNPQPGPTPDITDWNRSPLK